MNWQRSRWLVLALVALALAWSVVNSVRKVGQMKLSAKVCGAFENHDFEAAISASSALSSRTLRVSDRKLLEAVECRCLALVSVGRGESCSQEIAQWTERPALRHWIPQPVLAAAAIDELEKQRNFERAIDLAHAAAIEFPQSGLFHSREFRVRVRAAREDGGETAETTSVLLAEFEQRLVDLGDRSADLPMLLAARYSEDARWQDVVRVLGETPPRDPALAKEWFQLKTRGFAGLGDVTALAQSFDHWEEVLGASADQAAWRALQYALSNLIPFMAVVNEELAKALLAENQIGDVALRVAVRKRLIGGLTKTGQFEEALFLLDETVSRYGSVDGLDRTEIVRARRAAAGVARVGAVDERIGTLIFRGLGEGDQLLVSPAQWAQGNTAFERFEANERVTIRRTASDRPVWWLVLDSAGGVVAEGAVWVESGVVEEVEVTRGEALRVPAWRPVLARGDARSQLRTGRTRVIQLILDSGDWRIFHLLMAGNRVPSFQALLGIGAFGTILSDPPYTAAALQSLTRPAERTFGVLQLAHQLGEEVEALNFVGRNPVAGLGFLLPKVPTLFETLGSGSLRTVNLLRSVGSLDAGRNASVIGPHGAIGQLSGYRGRRELSVDELRAVPGLDRDLGEALGLFEEAAADFDTLGRILEESEIDFVCARVASLDLMTHAHYSVLGADGQRDRLPTLLLFYQYLDYRLGEVVARLKEMDYLIVMSDHGALSSLEHDPHATFLLTGPGVKVGAFETISPIAGVSRLVAELLGVETDWYASELLDLVGVDEQVE